MKGGIAIQREGGSPLWRINTFNPGAVRLSAPWWWDGRDTLKGYRDKGWDVALVLDRDGFEDWTDWRRSAERDFARVDDLYVKTGLAQALILGNEFDDGWVGGDAEDDPRVAPRGGVSSWTMPFAEQAEMVNRAWEHFRDRVPLILGGSSSGQPDALRPFDLSKLAAVSLHPYGKRPAVDWPGPNWGFGFVGWWLDAVREILGDSGCRLGIGELGLSSYDTDEGTQAEWYRRMVQYLSSRGDVDFCFAFCDSDQNVDGYGGYKVDERPKLWVPVVAELFARLPKEQPLIRPRKATNPLPPPPEPDVEASSPLMLHLPDADVLANEEILAVLDLKPAGLLAMCYAEWDADKGLAEQVRWLVRQLGLKELFVRFHIDPNPVKDRRGRTRNPEGWADLCARRMQQYYGELADEGVTLHAILYNEVDADYEGGIGPDRASDLFNRALHRYATARPGDVLHVPAPTGAPQTHREFLERFRADGWVEPQWWIDGHGYDGDLENVCNVLEEVFPDHYRSITETNDVDLAATAALVGVRAHRICYFILNWARGGEGRVQPPTADDAAKRMSLLRFPDRYAEFKATARKAVIDDGGGTPPDPDKPDEPEQPDEPGVPEGTGWWDRHFYPAEIATALAEVRSALGRPTHPDELMDEVRTYWPEFESFMEAYGLKDSVEAKIYLMATIWVENIYSFQTIDEVGTYDYFERMYGYQTRVGQMLGNVQPGDGWKYRARGYGLTGRNNYAWAGNLLGVDLVNDPEALDDPTLAAGALVAFCAQRGAFEAAQAGDWEQSRKIYNGGLNGWDPFILSVNTLYKYADEDKEPPQVDPEALRAMLRKVLDVGATRLGDPYVWDGERPGGFDCSGFVKWSYWEALAIALTSFTDALADEGRAISEAQALPGDWVLYEYVDPGQPGVRFPHVGLVTERPDIVLDARGGVGVGWHAHVQGAVRHYRRAFALPLEDQDEAMWREKAEKLISAVGYLGGDVADRLEEARARIDDYGEAPTQPKPDSKMTKADWQKYAEAMEAWAAKVREQTGSSYGEIGAVGSEIRRVKDEALA